MVDGMNGSGVLPVKLVYKGTANSSAEVADVMGRAEADPKCIGVITWMHRDQCGKCKWFRYCMGGGMHLRGDDGKLILCHMDRLANP